MGEVVKFDEYERTPQGEAMAAEEQNKEPIYYGTKEVARFLNCSIPRAREMMNRKDFPALKFGRIIRVYKPALEKWSMERHTC